MPRKPRERGTWHAMYHGTTWDRADIIEEYGFRPSEDGLLGQGVYLSKDLDKAMLHPFRARKADKVVIKVKVNVGKVFIIRHRYHPCVKTWHDNGYDTAWVPPDTKVLKHGHEMDCVWNPNRVTFLKLIDAFPD